jgi:CDP-diacylglycerol--serine O-phosphatidyltransferase
MLRRNLANYITCLNLVCGCLSILYCIRIDLQMAGVFIIAAAVLDFLDGFVARLVNGYSPIGKQLDSLADVVSFGVAPGFIVFALFYYNSEFLSIDFDPMRNWYSFAAFLLPCGSAWRLAKFNIDTRQSEGFIGMPVPSMGFIVAALPFIVFDSHTPEWFSNFLVHPITLIFIVLGLCYLMLSELKLISLKFKTYDFASNKPKYILLAVSAVLLVLLKFKAFPLIILSYIFISVTMGKEKLTVDNG